jgi:ankyrin repeat protein
MGIPLLLAAALLPESPIADAVMAGDLEAVRNLLRDGADVNEAQGDGLTGLHWAARNNDVEAARLLLYAGANVAAKTRIGAHTPVLVASRGGHAEVLDVLLEAGADPVARTTTGNSAPLHFAAAAGNPAAVEVLLRHGADVDARDGGSRHTPLMIAATYDHVAVAQALLANGADVTLTNEVVDMAAREREDRELRDRRERRIAFLQELRSGASNAPEEEAQAPPPEEPPPADEDAEEEEEAATAEHDEDAEEEPSPLSYPQLVGNHGGYSALHLAARQGSRGVAEVLLQAGADIDQPSAGDHTTPMLMASINGHWDMALDFLERGADPNIASAAGTTPLYAILNLHWAPAAFYPQPTAHLNQRTTYLEAMRTLLEAGADPNARLEKHLWFIVLQLRSPRSRHLRGDAVLESGLRDRRRGDEAARLVRCRSHAPRPGSPPSDADAAAETLRSSTPRACRRCPTAVLPSPHSTPRPGRATARDGPGTPTGTCPGAGCRPFAIWSRSTGWT